MVERAGTDTRTATLESMLIEEVSQLDVQVHDRAKSKLGKLHAQKPEFPHPLTTTEALDTYVYNLATHYVDRLDLTTNSARLKATSLFLNMFQDGIEAAEFIV